MLPPFEPTHAAGPLGVFYLGNSGPYWAMAVVLAMLIAKYASGAIRAVVLLGVVGFSAVLLWNGPLRAFREAVSGRDNPESTNRVELEDHSVRHIQESYGNGEPTASTTQPTTASGTAGTVETFRPDDPGTWGTKLPSAQIRGQIKTHKALRETGAQTHPASQPAK